MPLYEFNCQECFHSFEEVQGIKDPPLLFCPRCRGNVQRRFFDWEDKLAELRLYNKKISEAPFVPFFFSSLFILFLVCGLLGGVTYRGIYGFLGMILFSTGISGITLVGLVPIIGPILFLAWLGPAWSRFVEIHIGLGPSFLLSFVYWFAFVIALVLTVFTSLYLLYRIKTPIMWGVMEPQSQERFKYLLLSRLLNYEVSAVWLTPETFGAKFVCRLLHLQQVPAVHLMGSIYYCKDIPTGPIKAIENRRMELLKNALAPEQENN